MEHKWVDLLVKSFVKVGRVSEGVALTDIQLSGVDKVKDSMVHARVALSVYPWRRGNSSPIFFCVNRPIDDASILDMQLNAGAILMRGRNPPLIHLCRWQARRRGRISGGTTRSCSRQPGLRCP